MPIDPPNLLALKAALFPKEEALEAWSRLKEVFTIDDVHPELLALIFSNLVSWLEGDNLFGKLKGCHHYQWSKNQFLRYQLAQRLRLLNQEDIDVLLIGDAPVASRYFESSGARNLGHFELFVPREKIREAAALLERSSRADRNPDKHGFSISLRSNILLGPGRDQCLWRHRSRIEILDATACILDPVDQLFYALLAINRNAVALWIIDVLMVASFPELELNTLDQRAHRYAVTARLKDKVNFFYSQFQPHPTVPALERISGLKVDASELLEQCVFGLGAFSSATLRFATTRLRQLKKDKAVSQAISD